ncbi:TraQ conjugal transfer family protein [Porphyromonas levii]|nr:TraQ conjugal transfer family protein [Porphyromonas levii]MBR8765556.1 hypothetical protein [Porphyromonas levii]
MRRLMFIVGGLILLWVVTAISFSCRSNIEYATTTGFELRHDDYRPAVSSGINTVIKVYLKEQSDLRDNYYVLKFFSAKGDGKAYLGKELTRLEDNAWKMLPLLKDPISKDKMFLFNYTPYSYGDHEMIVSVRDGDGNERRINFKFTVEKK